jgi:predicted acetyltransferase
MSEIFRPARPSELPEIIRLMTHSFPAPTRTMSWWEETLVGNPYGGRDPLWVGEDDGRLVAACQLYPREQWIGGSRMPVMGLGAVAIAPTHRRRGLAGRFVSAGLRRAQERGDVASALYPFRISFYERLGYGLAGEAHQYRVPPEALPDAPERAGVRLADSDVERAALRKVYDAWIRGQTGQMHRSTDAWDRVWESTDVSAVVYRGEKGEAEGYAIVRYRADLPSAERYLEVEERAWLTSAAQRGIYAWLSSLGDQWRELLYRAHPGEGFAEIVRDPRMPWGSAPGWGLWFPSATLLRGPMFRLLNLRAAWEMRSVAAADAMTLGLEVVDEQVPENGGSWRLRLEQGRVEVTSDARGSADTTLSLSIGALSRIFIGDLAPSAAVAAGVATAGRSDSLPLLDRLLYLPRPWTYDRF